MQILVGFYYIGAWMSLFLLCWMQQNKLFELCNIPWNNYDQTRDREELVFPNYFFTKS